MIIGFKCGPKETVVVECDDEGRAKMSTELLCPSCEGKRGHPAIVCIRGAGGRRCETRRLDCNLCKGRGKVSEERSERYRIGRLNREVRVSQGKSQSEKAEELRITPQELSRKEQGL